MLKAASPIIPLGSDLGQWVSLRTFKPEGGMDNMGFIAGWGPCRW